jgi:hypothetical protein
MFKGNSRKTIKRILTHTEPRFNPKIEYVPCTNLILARGNGVPPPFWERDLLFGPIEGYIIVLYGKCEGTIARGHTFPVGGKRWMI